MQASFRRLPWPEILILLLAAVLRFAALDLKPPHFDEGVNGWFADQMAHTGFYNYDPTNYHGPLHMYAVFIAQKLLGREIWALRLPVVLVSIACVWLTLRFGRFIGDHAARWAALAMAVSPASVFYGRYSIHETWLVAFLLLTAWGILEVWKSGSRAGVFAIAGGVAGMILTKETYFIHIGCFLLAIPTLALWQMLSPSRPGMPLAMRQWTIRDLTLASAFAAAAIVFFYSGTFLDWEGLRGLYQTYYAWFDTGIEKAHHAKTDFERVRFHLFGHRIDFKTYLNYYWPAMMAYYEWPALLGLLAAVRLLWPTPAQIRYLAIYGAGALVAYSIIPYKTPWLIIAMLWPFFLTFGAAMQEFRKVPAAVFIGAIALAMTVVVSLRLNFVHYDDPKEPYVYVQTHRSIRKLTDPLLDLARRDPAAHEITGEFYLDSYYPLPWMLGEFPNISYPQGKPERDIVDDVVAAEKGKADDVEKHLTEPYFRREFRLRDAQEDCVAWFRASKFEDMMHGEPIVGPETKKP